MKLCNLLHNFSSDFSAGLCHDSVPLQVVAESESGIAKICCKQYIIPKLTGSRFRVIGSKVLGSRFRVLGSGVNAERRTYNGKRLTAQPRL